MPPILSGTAQLPCLENVEKEVIRLGGGFVILTRISITPLWVESNLIYLPKLLQFRANYGLSRQGFRYFWITGRLFCLWELRDQENKPAFKYKQGR